VVVALATAGCLPWEDLSSGYDAGLGGGATASSSAGVGAGAGAGGDGGGGAGGAGGAGDPCPATGRGPTMVRVAYQLTELCIDSTEVTDDQYEVFVLDPDSDPSRQPAECVSNTTYASTNPGDRRAFPAVGVDHCDAKAFCKWAGKRLCGPVERGDLVWSFPSPQESEWTFACTEAGAHPRPYGDAAEPGTCNFSGGLMGVGTNPGCEVGSLGIFDMLGNVWEWVDQCAPAADAGPDAAECIIAGGSYQHDYQIECGKEFEATRGYTNEDLGFRCCASVL
jgi:formylglycine-generating enzyme